MGRNIFHTSGGNILLKYCCLLLSAREIFLLLLEYENGIQLNQSAFDLQSFKKSLIGWSLPSGKK